VACDLLLQQDDPAQQLVLEAAPGDGEVHHGRPGADLGAEGRVGQLGGDVEAEALHHVHLLVPHLHLQEETTALGGNIHRIYILQNGSGRIDRPYKLIQT